jgi:uncharacterized protein YukE
MADARELLALLEEYAAAIDRRLALLKEKHEQLGAYWIPAREHYQGSGAEVFAEVMEQANSSLQTVADNGAAIQSILKQKIEELRAFDSATSPEL